MLPIGSSDPPLITKLHHPLPTKQQLEQWAIEYDQSDAVRAWSEKIAEIMKKNPRGNDNPRRPPNYEKQQWSVRPYTSHFIKSPERDALSIRWYISAADASSLPPMTTSLHNAINANFQGYCLVVDDTISIVHDSF